MNMRKPISITLDVDNLLWLRGQAAATSKGSVSEVVDRVVTEARLGRGTMPEATRCVVGTIDLPEDDSSLEHADTYIRSLFSTSLRRPLLVKEQSPRSSRTKARRG
jgi:hypothetical protein